MTLYNLTVLTQASDPGAVLTFANTNATGGLLGGLFLISWFFIAFFYMNTNKRGYEALDCLLAAASTSFVLSLVFRYAGWANFKFVLGFLVIIAFSVLGKFVFRRR